MHITEGFLPIKHAVGTTFAAAARAVCGFVALKTLPHDQFEAGLPLGIAAAFSQAGKGVR